MTTATLGEPLSAAVAAAVADVHQRIGQGHTPAQAIAMVRAHNRLGVAAWAYVLAILAGSGVHA